MSDVAKWRVGTWGGQSVTLAGRVGDGGLCLSTWPDAGEWALEYEGAGMVLEDAGGGENTMTALQKTRDWLAGALRITDALMRKEVAARAKAMDNRHHGRASQISPGAQVAAVCREVEDRAVGTTGRSGAERANG